MSTATPLTWVITGANSGLGLALAQYVLSRGDKVIAAVRDVSKVPQSLSTALAVKLDVSATHAEIADSVQEILRQHGKIDVLVNNAGYCLTGPVEELHPSSIQAQFQTNVFGAISMIQALLPSFREQKSGWILNFSSIAGFAGGPGFGAYNASKAALEVEPGFFPTNFLSTATANKVPDAEVTGHYTDHSQGYRASERYHGIHLDDGQVGDPAILAQRVFEVVHREGPARELFSGEKRWTRIPIGVDCW
ncbi:NAD-P-binding protein [Flagelloscypha sp. PMI_526]|nr:NAD-P-binding protein [Flagelloscypha sp. PMI_526]